VTRTISPRHAEIGAFVTNVVEAWDSTTLVNRLELQVGEDLQYIRINGTLVGCLVAPTRHACKSSCSAVLVATNFIVGRYTASAIPSPSRKSFFCPFK
jgi:hypothetical protein